ncbi:uncharacterized protein [Aristolochia californica]|uniref:uncharacterized protein n=1 Tax=Aristolochia californica TaxID=171875 RepID=UPI0035DF4DCA
MFCGMEDVVEVISKVNGGSHLVTGWDSLEAEEVGVALDVILNIKDECDELSFPEHMKVAEVKQDCEVGCRATKNQKKLSKSATFTSAERHSGAAFDGEGSIASGNASFARASSLPSSLKLVSALKGGREQLGLPPKAKTNVKWAADVYEPPTTSMSHTVRSSHTQRQYYRSTKRKDSHRHKHKKGNKSTRAGNGEKKRLISQKSVSSSDNLRQRVHASPAQLPIAGVEFALSGNQESKCGSNSFLMASLTKVHYSVAEA